MPHGHKRGAGAISILYRNEIFDTSFLFLSIYSFIKKINNASNISNNNTNDKNTTQSLCLLQGYTVKILN